MTLRCLFVDFNSYFAAVEQYDEPDLIGRPVAVVPVLATTTCCIAASYEAKARGVTTGTQVGEALERCPDLVIRQARPARYVEMHHKLMDAIEDCVPHGTPLSIDEAPCWLIGDERDRENAEAIARKIKQAFIDRGYSPAIRCSIGIAPNLFLAKTASDMQKPDGLTVIEKHDLPDALHGLELRDFCGIGRSMEARLRRAGIHTAKQLCTAARKHLRTVWGSIEGERYWLQLRGFELPERETRRGSIGHSHVLGPELRDYAGARAVLLKLLAKAAMRLRHEGFFAGGMAVRIRFVGIDKRFERDLSFAPLHDTPTLLRLLTDALRPLEQAHDSGRWNSRRHPPLSAAVTLTRLQPVAGVTESLIPQRERAEAVSDVLDAINRRFGNNTLYFGAMQPALARDAAPMRIPFSNIPDAAMEEDVTTRHDAANHELWTQRERQFKALAEQVHREGRERRKPGKGKHRKTGAGGWDGEQHHQSSPGINGELF